jgi:hypothetical protein
MIHSIVLVIHYNIVLLTPVLPADNTRSSYLGAALRKYHLGCRFNHSPSTKTKKSSTNEILPVDAPTELSTLPRWTLDAVLRPTNQPLTVIPSPHFLSEIPLSVNENPLSVNENPLSGNENPLSANQHPLFVTQTRSRQRNISVPSTP